MREADKGEEQKRPKALPRRGAAVLKGRTPSQSSGFFIEVRMSLKLRKLTKYFKAV